MGVNYCRSVNSNNTNNACYLNNNGNVNNNNVNNSYRVRPGFEDTMH